MFRKKLASCYIYIFFLFAAGFENFGIRQFHEELLHRFTPTQFIEFSERLESDGVEGACLSYLGIRANRLGIKYDED